MGGMQETVRLQKTLNKVKAANDTRDAIWHSLAADLYSAWAKELPAQVQRPGTDIMKLDRLSRISGLVGQSQLSVGAIPQIALRIQEVDQYRQWLGKRFQDESVAAGVSTAFGKFCAEAAADYQR